MYTASEDVPLRDILNRIHDAQKEKLALRTRMGRK